MVSINTDLYLWLLSRGFFDILSEKISFERDGHGRDWAPEGVNWEPGTNFL